MKNIILRNYPKYNYKVIFNQDTGFFARIENDGEDEPFWSPMGPELLDISITNWCDKGCSFCYKKSNTFGTHMTITDYRKIMDEAKKNNVFQVALGGGNPNQHPEFCEILKLTRKEYNIVPSYTTNGNGLSDEVLLATNKYCGAVAISAYKPFSNMANSIELLLSYNIKTNIHFLLDKNTINIALKWLISPPSFLKNINSIIFLNYKPLGKSKDSTLNLSKNIKYKELFNIISSKSFTFKIGFDSCSVSGIVKHMKNINSNSIEPCDSSRFSAYISEDLNVYPCSFMTENYKGLSLKDYSLKDIWLDSSAFKSIRNKLNSNKCSDCSHIKNCLNGCPIFPEINLCD